LIKFFCVVAGSGMWDMEDVISVGDICKLVSYAYGGNIVSADCIACFFGSVGICVLSCRCIVISF